MGIYWLKHDSIGRTTHAQGTAGSHLKYITRPSACSFTDAHLMPADRWKARYWLNKQELASRKNARVIDKVVLALPRQLHPFQRNALAKRFVLEVTGGKVPFFIAVHDIGKDANNPHAHIIIRDNCPETGRKVLGLSKAGSSKRLHKIWRALVAELLNQKPKTQPSTQSHNASRTRPDASGMALSDKGKQSFVQAGQTCLHGL